MFVGFCASLTNNNNSKLLILILKQLISQSICLINFNIWFLMVQDFAAFVMDSDCSSNKTTFRPLQTNGDECFCFLPKKDCREI